MATKNTAKPEADSTPEAEKPIEFEPAPGTADATSEVTGETVTVSTSGAFMLLDPYTGAVVPAFESATVPLTGFISEKIEAGVLIVE